VNDRDSMGENDLEMLNELLIPSTKNVLVDLQNICFDDMDDRLDNEEKSKYMIAIILDLVKVKFLFTAINF
jgi:hypothetical protein